MWIILSLYIGLFSKADADQLIKAKDMESFLFAEEQWETSRRLHRNCQEELKIGVFPENCLSQLEHWVGDPTLMQESQNLYSKIAQRCVVTASKIQSFEKIKVLLKSSGLTESCRMALVQRRDDLSYQTGITLAP